MFGLLVCVHVHVSSYYNKQLTTHIAGTIETRTRENFANHDHGWYVSNNR